jgi:hypothetical protein
MSSNDLNDWTESLDFESLADEQETGGAAPEAEYIEPADEAEPALETAEAADESTAEPAPKVLQPPRRDHVSGNGVATLFAAATLVAGVGMAGGLVVSLGIDPAAMWHPEGLMRFERILDFRAYPLNMFYFVTCAVVGLVTLASYFIARAVRRVDERASREAEILDKITALRIDEEHGWQDEVLREHPTVAAFVTENIGAWRLQEARQRRYAGLEAELQRLSKAAATDDRAGLGGRYDNPNVSTLADEIVRYFDERKVARKQAAALDAADRETSEKLMQLVMAARGWTAAAMDRVGTQGATAERAAESLYQTIEGWSAAANDDPVSRSAAAVAALRKHLATEGATTAAPAAEADFDELVDRGNKLAFQIAMEVARLGPRGERLLPMTQALEELTTEFREAAEHVTAVHKNSDALVRLDGRLEQLHGVITEAGAKVRDWQRSVGEAAPAVAEVAAKLYGLAKGFDGQSERLNQVGEHCGSLTGISFDPSIVPAIDPVEMPEVELGLTRFEPFAGRGEEAPETAAGDFPYDEPEPEMDPLAGFDFEQLGAGSETPPAAQLEDPSFPAEAEPVYDVARLGAVPLDEPESATDPFPELERAPEMAFSNSTVEEAVDLAAFGAVRLDDDAPGFGPETAAGENEDVHDLSEFGAVPLD